CTPPSGSFFPVGTTVVQCSAQDAAGNVSVTNFSVTVLDRTPPQIVPPATVFANNDLNQCGAVVTFQQPAANDTCSTVTNIICTPPSGSFFPVGTTVVQCSAEDAAGNVAVTNFSVTVLDRTPPQIITPTKVWATNALNQCGAVVTFQQPSASDSCSTITNITCTPPSGSFFPVGTTVVRCSAQDAAGNLAVTNFSVTVLDRQPPTIVCPGDMTVTNAHDAWTSMVTFNPSAQDNCSGVGAVVCTPPSGTALAPGRYTVNCWVADAAGNSSSCSFHVSVWPGNQPPVPVIALGPLVNLPGYTNFTVIAPDGVAADVICDGQRSYDPDDASFLAGWYVGTHLFSTNIVAGVKLPVGLHTITLLLDDTYPYGRSAESVQVEVISPDQAIGLLENLVQAAQLTGSNQRTLLAILDAAMASADKQNLTPEINQLGAFENKVRSQVMRSDPDLANELLQAAQQIIQALSP
ncbi:MAG: hypothetical protein C5B50_07540, partial [Verrucomicrobia bacterium]